MPTSVQREQRIRFPWCHHLMMLSLLTLVFSSLFVAAMSVSQPMLAQDAGTARIEIAKYVCSRDFDAYSATAEDLIDECFFAGEFPPVAFTLDLADGSSTTIETVEGLATFETGAVASDAPIILSEVLPDGVGEPVVACAVMSQETGAAIVDFTLIPVVNGNGIEIEPGAGETVSCNWFNVFAGVEKPESVEQDDTTSEVEVSPVANNLATLTVVVHGCSAGVDAAMPPAELLAGCQGHPVALFSAGDFDDFYEANTTSGANLGNLVQFTDVPAVELTISLLRPQSATTLAVYCTATATADDTSTWERSNVANGRTVSRDIEVAEQATCHWFNDSGDVEGDLSRNTVEIKAWNCSPGTEPGRDEWTYYFGACKTVGLDTTFTLVSTDGTDKAVMAGDWATWQGVGAGAFTIQGATPEGFGEPVIVCGSYHGSSLTIDWPTATTGEFFATFDDEVGQIMTCDWFNLPASNGVSLPTGD